MHIFSMGNGLDQFKAAKELYLNKRTKENLSLVNDSFLQFVKDDEEIYALMYDSAKTPDKKSDYLPISLHGNTYIVLGTNEMFVTNLKVDIPHVCSVVKFSDVLKTLLNNGELEGIVFDVENGMFMMGRDRIVTMLALTDPRRGTKNWGNGVPAYTWNDIMTPHEIQNFGVNTVAQKFAENKYEILEVHNGIGLESWPNILAKKDNVTYGIIVGSGIAPNRPVFDEKLFNYFDIDKIKEKGVVTLFASICFCSADVERRKRGLALICDSFTIDNLDVTELKKSS